ncbi:unnamed protein product [Dicrocoelium dendriticum]|nr:unnamed protein product [Dicrocoelium dendriticum]
MFSDDLARSIASCFALKISRYREGLEDRTTTNGSSAIVTLSNCSIQNAVPCNEDKCRVAQLRHRHNYTYLLGTNGLKTSSHECDLGVNLQCDLNCSVQAEVAAK